MCGGWRWVWHCSILRATLRFPRAIDHAGMGGEKPGHEGQLAGVGSHLALPQSSPPLDILLAPSRGPGMWNPGTTLLSLRWESWGYSHRKGPWRAGFPDDEAEGQQAQTRAPRGRGKAGARGSRSGGRGIWSAAQATRPQVRSLLGLDPPPPPPKGSGVQSQEHPRAICAPPLLSAHL